MTVQEVLQKTQSFFKNKGIETARLDAELLISHGLGWPRVNLYTKFDYPMNDEELADCRSLVKRRSEGEPVAYILGKKGFYNEEFIVSPDVLIPRPETEKIVDLAISKFQEGIQIVDLGTGSGCLGLSLLKEIKNSKLTAVDISKEALEIAKQNAEALELDNVEFIHSDAKEVNLPEADLIVANPPYIAEDSKDVEENVKSFEPTTALFAKDNGLQEIYLWTEKAVKNLKPGGSFFCEMGFDQKAAVEKFLMDKNYNYTFYKDDAGLDRGFEVING